MNNRKLAELGPLRLAGIAMAGSIISAILVLLAGRLFNRAETKAVDTSANRIPPQPEVDMAMPATVPTHFTEELILPNFTETGADVERDDDTRGRSPEGV
jgi:hypothetical protein